MKIKKDKIQELIDQITDVIENIKQEETAHKNIIKETSGTYKKSARNLIHYDALRKHDIRPIQKKLKNFGLSRLSRADGHVMASLLNANYVLNSLLDDRPKKQIKSGLSIKNSKRHLTRHTKELLGFRSKGRRVRIMVTQPTEAAYNYEMVFNMVKNGMNCARVNCAHDGPEVWEKIIKNVKKAAKALGKNVKITMDLAGPKIRTGAIKPGPKIRKFSPERDESGVVLKPALVVMVDAVNEESEPNTLPIDLEWRKGLVVGDRLKLVDTRNKERILKVVHIQEDQVWLNCYDTSYIGTGSVLNPERAGLEPIEVGEIPAIERSILLRVDDLFRINRDEILGEPAEFDEDGNILKQAHVSCPVPEIYKNVKPNDKVLFDDGKIEGIIETASEDHFEVRILRAKELGTRLKAEKGINFPFTDLGISGLTDKDKDDLPFVAEHADVVNFSFVNSKQDVEELFTELGKLDALNKLSIILKIETRKSFNNLKEILLTAMRVKYVGVMIARGDLAVETGWSHIGRIQKEILSFCNAAHIPVVWATQVLESLAKKGLPSRSEITDATTSLKAECVMLNKGLYINDAISLLNNILGDMENFAEKNEEMMPQLEHFL
ncbi:MAG: pyruvate kinase [Bacteroidota bacterium]